MMGRFFNEVFVFGGPRRLAASVGRMELVDEIGLEKPHKSLGISQILLELSTKLSNFDMGSLWKTLGDSERRKLFAFTAEILNTLDPTELTSPN